MTRSEDIKALTSFFFRTSHKGPPNSNGAAVGDKEGTALLQQQINANRLKEQELQQLTRLKPQAGDFIPNLGVTDNVKAYLHACGLVMLFKILKTN